MRFKTIDILRGLAIIGVLFRHSTIDTWYSRPGWAGVDLFFVLSGFLVSGLLFYEFKKNAKVNVRLFLIRRGFKIYPAFYIYLIISLVTSRYYLNVTFPIKNIISEVFFLQSYFESCNIHTWSLAIEEHFYILLSLFILVAVYKKWINKFNLMISVFIISIIVVLLLRCQYVYTHFNEEKIFIFKTHMRLDGLLIGVLVSYLYHFSNKFKIFIVKFKFILIVLAMLLISLPFLFKSGTIIMLTYGMTLMQGGFGLIISLVVIYSNKLENLPFPSYFIAKPLMIIGRYSYSIYLWHLFLFKILANYMNRVVPVPMYFIFVISGGICFSLLIEQIFLKIRDYYFPSKIVTVQQPKADYSRKTLD